MKVLIFGGTSEGRKLSETLSTAGFDVTLSVATEFGRNTAEKSGRTQFAPTTALVGRLNGDDIAGLLTGGNYDCVIDATHPYAVLVTQNIRLACKTAGIKYYRLKRPESAVIPGITYVPDAVAAAEILSKREDNVLLTVGSKELEAFTSIENYAARFFVRILPMPDSLQKALELGFSGSNIICMQGSFDQEMNIATLKMTGAKFLVTKDSGDAGGFGEKVFAALSLGCEVIVIKRPIEEEGYSFDEILSIIHRPER